MKFYTWKDIERYCLMNKSIWETCYETIEVYPSEISAYAKQNCCGSIQKVFSELFHDHFTPSEKMVILDVDDKRIPVYEQEALDSSDRLIRPLFRNVIYQPSSYPSNVEPALPRPVIAFHSYKGGVGRTLSLLAFAKAWSAEFEKPMPQTARLLIVDADIEAPGITWAHENMIEDTFSYLDLLTMIQDCRDVESVITSACSKLKTSTITLETPKRSIEHIFIPTYRYKEQLLDLYASPESIVNGYNKEYILSYVLSRICANMGLSAVLVDLRAGISEYSSTLLLDPRVKKYLVTSTSTQSIMGTQILLEYLLRGLPIRADTILPEVFINMIPDGLSEVERGDLISSLSQYYEQEPQDDPSDSFIDNVITELPFASELIHLTSVKQIVQNLNGREMYLRIQNLVHQNYNEETKDETSVETGIDRDELLGKIHNLASRQLTAEGNEGFDILMTEPLRYLTKKYSDSIPATVVMGAKGSGKTFLYRKMAESQDWQSFCDKLNNSIASNRDGLFLPVIATKNSNELLKTLNHCLANIRNILPSVSPKDNVFLDAQSRIEQQKHVKADWFQFWQEILASSIDPKLNSLQEANEQVKRDGKKIIFLIDGLEDILKDVAKDANEQQAVQVLCQDIVTQIAARYKNLGIVVFVRRDMIRNSITVNTAQFEDMYKQSMLKWSSNEALRLAVWLVSQADSRFYCAEPSIDVASRDIIDTSLIKLWGLKLGKPTSNEAYSSRWILAALADFNGQLQARDIIRFLSYATEHPGRKPPYSDRVLMPAEIKAAVSSCSKEKLDEVKQEYAALKPIFERLENLKGEDKRLPFEISKLELSSEEEKNIIAEGYLKRDGNLCYLPEIIRHALGFKYEKGARPKVISLTLKR